MISIDLETLSLKPNAVILSIGIVQFNPLWTSEMQFDKAPQMELFVNMNWQKNRDINRDTLIFWLSHDPSYLLELLEKGRNSGESMKSTLSRIDNFMGAEDRENIWVRGNKDQEWLESLHASVAMAPPWKYSAFNDVRTLAKQFQGIEPPERDPNKIHRALDDAIHQAKHVSAILRHIRNTEIHNIANG